MLRKRNELLKKHQKEATDALSDRINSLITRRNATYFERFKCGIEWAVERSKLAPGVRSEGGPVSSHSHVTKSALWQNFHGRALFPPRGKATVMDSTRSVVDAATNYELLETMGRTAAWPGGLPSWFLVHAAPMIAEPVAHLHITSVHLSYVPPQCNTSIITSAYIWVRWLTINSISMTPILRRLLEKCMVPRYFHPVLPEPKSNTLQTSLSFIRAVLLKPPW